MAQKLYLISTGGTIEKVYSETTGTVRNVDFKLDRYLQSLRLPDLDIDAVRLMNKDSLEMTDADRDLILATIRAKLVGQAAPFVITHGTDTLVETGLHLKASLPDLAVPVVLTGAMTPLGFERSDGLQNLTESLIAARILPAGVWLVMHNEVFPIDRVKKDRERAVFVSK